MDSNNQIEPCLSRKSSEGKPQIFTTLRNIDLNLLTIFEAVYVHKGIVNAAKVLNLTPSAISQSIQKLRVIFPDPLFIRKGQGVTPTAFAMHLHEYISQGLESILGALDIEGSYDLDGDLGVLRDLHQLGLRSAQLSAHNWNQNYSDSCCSTPSR